MLDLDKLYTDFQLLIERFDDTTIENWIRFDNNRLLLSRLLAGEKVEFKCADYQTSFATIQTTNRLQRSFTNEIGYRSAA